MRGEVSNPGDESTVSFRRAVAVLTTGDMAASLGFFIDVLGFDVDFVWGEPPTYAAVERGDAEIHLRNDPAARGRAEVTVMIEGVDAYYGEVLARDGAVGDPPADRPYGMRDFAVRTPDGHRLTFGESLHG